ncbi:MAG: hypothetical protein OXC42_06345 [Gammaproteobacteria bacterium]|nr:hypothetical protein [Gammaproteobacteria bacterium]
MINEESTQDEVQSFITIGSQRLADAQNTGLSINSRFVLAYDACFSLAYAALRRSGFRANKNAQGHRSTVISTLEHTIQLGRSKCRVVNYAHTKCNGMEYEGYFDVGNQLVDELIEIAVLINEKLGNENKREA